jgi:hypothetical protein
MEEALTQSDVQLGLLDPAVDLSVPEVYSGTQFTLYLHVKNPFSRPVWISSVELSLPTQLSVQRPQGPLRKRPRDSRASGALIRNLIKQHKKEISRLRQLLDSQELGQEPRDKAQSRLSELEAQVRANVASLSGGLVIDSSDDADLNVYQPKASIIYARASQASQIHIYQPQVMEFTERVPLLSSLPPGAALQPGSTDVWTIRLGSRRTPFFIPARYKLQLTVIYGLEPESPTEEKNNARDGGENNARKLCSNTSSFNVQVRAALWSVILGGVIGGVVGSVARSLQGVGGETAFSGTHANSTIGALALSAILSGAAVIFSARKTEAQSFVTVEDFWGGLLIGFLIGYSGTAAFAKITASPS